MSGSLRAAMSSSSRWMVMVVASAVFGGCGSREAKQPGSAPAESPARSEAVSPNEVASPNEAVSPNEAAAVQNPAIPSDALRIGEAVTVAAAPIKLADVRANPAAYFEKTLLVEGTAAAVCQSKGCWMTITDGAGEPIWVRWSTGCGGQFAFPKDAAGRHVILQGSFYPKEISPADAEHIAQESKGLKADDIAGKTFEINATACVVLPQAVGAPPPSS